jgi:hypothetical protein
MQAIINSCPIVAILFLLAKDKMGWTLNLSYMARLGPTQYIYIYKGRNVWAFIQPNPTSLGLDLKPDHPKPSAKGVFAKHTLMSFP